MNTTYDRMVRVRCGGIACGKVDGCACFDIAHRAQTKINAYDKERLLKERERLEARIIEISIALTKLFINRANRKGRRLSTED